MIFGGLTCLPPADLGYRNATTRVCERDDDDDDEIAYFSVR